MSRRFVAVVALLGTAWCLQAARAHACTCKPLSPTEAFAAATSVFEGRVLAISERLPQAQPQAQPLPHREVTLAVVRTWKGLDAEERVVVNTAADGAACGYGFAPETSYLVYARATDGAPWVSLCSGTRPMAEAAEDLNVLGMGQTPVDPKADPLPAEPEDEPPAQGGCASCAVRPSSTAGAHAWLSALLLGAVLWLRLRSRARRHRAAAALTWLRRSRSRS